MRIHSNRMWSTLLPILASTFFSTTEFKQTSYKESIVSSPTNSSEYFACTNDAICDAIDFGVLTFPGTAGNIDLGIYDNYCSNNFNEPNPVDEGSFWNDAGLWYTFSTNANPGPLIVIESKSDPEQTGDDINLEMAVYKAVEGTCNQTMEFVDAGWDPITSDARILLRCPEANTTYYVLVDAVGSVPDGARGVFGFAVYQPVISEAADKICQAHPLGAVSEGGIIQTDTPWSNFCATGEGDPHTTAFNTQVGVWFEFTAPPSGHVRIDGFADTTIFPLGVQLGLFGTSDGTCTGSLQEFGSSFSDSSLDEQLQVTCLYPGQPYWILIDGFGAGGIGVFSLSIQDAGDITPRTRIDTVLCAGASIAVAGNTYSETGTYQDSIQLYEGCDSIISTNLLVLEPIVIEFEEISPAIGLNEANGSTRSIVSGGTGNYNIQWCNGETGPMAAQLTGNTECCVTVTDDLGCEAQACFTVGLETIIEPTFQASVLDCFGDTDGMIDLSVTGGIAPYSYSWLHEEFGLEGNGRIQSDEETIRLNDLPGGSYVFQVVDGFGAASFVVEIAEPDVLILELSHVEDVSCFGFCDGKVEYALSGGTGQYTFSWEGPTVEIPRPDNLCAGAYALTVSDENNCAATISFSIAEPPLFEAQATVDRDVSCYDGQDGQVSVTTTGDPIKYSWSHGDSLATAGLLTAGTYEVTVTNVDGCEDTTSALVVQPMSAVEVGITIERPISCFDAGDGRLQANVVGPGDQFSYNWSNGHEDKIIELADEGSYLVTVTNERGCTAMDSILLEEPAELLATFEVRSISCRENGNDGAVLVSGIQGGNPPYEYALDDGGFQAQSSFVGLLEGSHRLVLRDQSNCIIEYPFYIEGPPDVSVNLGPDVTIRLGDSLDISGETVGENLVYRWYEGPEIANQNTTKSATFSPFFTTRYSLSIVDTISACSAFDEVLVTVDKRRRVYVPNAFSPNGDDRNETLVVLGGNDIELVKSLRIFNRYGALIHEAYNFFPGDQNAGWDGNYNGQKMPIGVYVYFAEIDFIDGKTEVFKGEAVLVR